MIRDTSATDRQMKAAPMSPVRRYGWIAGALVALLGLFWLVPSVARLLSVTATVSGERLRIAEVKRGDLVRDVSVQGRVVAAVSPTLYTPAAGTVTLAINAGDKVEKDQVLADVDSPELNNKLAQEKQTVESLKVDVERSQIDSRKQQLTTQKTLDQAQVDRVAAQREVERNEEAFRKGAIAEMTVLRAKDALTKAELTVGHAIKDVALERESLEFELKTKRLALARQKLTVTDLERQVDALKIRSPVSGQVGQLLIAQKANVAANAALLTVIDLSALELEVQVPETFAHDLGVGMNAQIREGDKIYAGSVSAISPEVVNNLVTGRIRFGDNKPDGLRQNQRLTTRILMDEHPNVLIVERGPFVDAGAGRVAYVVHDGIAERRAIQVGATSLNAVELLTGVNEGERIVVAGSDEFNGAPKVNIR
jgi:HlyD family secretion protein